MKTEEFQALCKPLFRFLEENCNPHQSIIIDENSARIVSDELSTPNLYGGQQN